MLVHCCQHPHLALCPARFVSDVSLCILPFDLVFCLSQIRTTSLYSWKAGICHRRFEMMHLKNTDSLACKIPKTREIGCLVSANIFHVKE